MGELREGTEVTEIISPFTGVISNMEFVLVKGGCFRMGDIFGEGDSDEKPVHEVCVDDFYIGKYPVTQGQWKELMGDNPSRFQAREEDNLNLFVRALVSPVENVSWNDAQRFIKELNQRTGKNYRLPTEAEWEYAARSGGKKQKYAGTSNKSKLREYAWHDKNSDRRTHPVGQKKPNGLGIHDMSGNVWEWCEDWYRKDYYRTSPKNNPQGPDKGEFRVLRGGSWSSRPRDVRASSRLRGGLSLRVDDIGFRLALCNLITPFKKGR